MQIPDQTAAEGAVWSGSSLFAIPLNIVRDKCIKSTIWAKIVWKSVGNFRRFTVLFMLKKVLYLELTKLVLGFNRWIWYATRSCSKQTGIWHPNPWSIFLGVQEYMYLKIYMSKFLCFLMLSALGKKSSRQHTEIFFLFFPGNSLNISCKMSPMEIICMKSQILFPGKNKKNIINVSSSELAQRVVKVGNTWKRSVQTFQGI